MKRIDLFCTSQASTAICSNMDLQSMVRHGGGVGGSRAIDRHNPHLRDPRRTRGFINPTSSSSYHQLPTTNNKPKPYNNHKKQTSTRKSSAKSTDLFSPPGSSRYLLSDTAFFDVLSDFDPVSDFDHPVSAFDSVSALVPIGSTRPLNINPDQSPAFKPCSSTRSHDQVVVLRVSLHCKGCEGKVRKHISRMQGVTSFSIDFASKKVTVVGDITPLGVLASVSRVKSAQFWPSSALASSMSVGSTY